MGSVVQGPGRRRGEVHNGMAPGRQEGEEAKIARAMKNKRYNPRGIGKARGGKTKAIQQQAAAQCLGAQTFVKKQAHSRIYEGK